MDVKVKGDLLYLGVYFEGLKIYDISVPKAPVELNPGFSLPPVGIDIRGRYAYLAGGDYGLFILDVAQSDRAVPGRYPMICRATRIA